MVYGLSKTKHRMLISMGKNVEALAGEATSEKIMEGSEEITEKTDKMRTAEWVRGAMQRLDALIGEETRIQIMENCGRDCADANKRLIDSTKLRRKKSRSAEEFLEAEQKKPMTETRLVRKGNVLYQFYTPKAFTRPMRCYCGLLRGLPDKATISKTYCHCSKGFVKKFWESVLERPVKVEIIQSAVSGADECKFAIHL